MVHSARNSAVGGVALRASSSIASAATTAGLLVVHHRHSISIVITLILKEGFKRFIIIIIVDLIGNPTLTHNRTRSKIRTTAIAAGVSSGICGSWSRPKMAGRGRSR